MMRRTVWIFALGSTVLSGALGAMGCSSELDSPPPANGATDNDGTSDGSDDAADDGQADDGAGDDGASDDGAGDDGTGPGDDGPTPSTTNDPDVPGTVPTEPATPPKLACEAPAQGAPTLRLLTRLEFENTLRDIFPSVAGQWSSSLPANTLSSLGFDNAISSTVGNQFAEDLLQTAQDVATAVTGSALANILPCSTSAADRACASEFVQQYGKRLFRRPLTEAEQERYLTFFDSALSQTDFATALQWVLVGLIQSPNAVYRSELGSGDTERTLTPYEQATELAYTFTGTTPSEALLAQADAGDLGDLTQAARDMLTTEAGRQTLHRFFEAYFSYPRTEAKAKPNAVTDGITYADVSADMVEETRRFIDDVVFTQQGNITDLLTSQSTNPSQRLAQYYGFAAPSADFAALQRPDGQGLGLLSQGSFLATHANSDASSPTQRGVFVYTKLLCQPKPQLPDNVPQLPAAQPAQQTTRQRYENVHATDAACKGCHALFDPIGFSFEHFDEAGRYRETENTLTIDATGSLVTPTGTELAFDGVEQLVTGLAEDRAVQECFSAYMATYAFGSSKACLGPSQVSELQAGNIGIVEAFARLAGEPHFTQRSTQ